VSDANLFAQQESNRRRSVWLVAGFILFFAWVGFGGDVAWALLSRGGPAGHQHVVPVIGIVTTLVAAGICWYSWRYGSERILWATGAWELVEPATPEQKQLVNVVEEMAIASGLPKPRIWIVPDADPNAFATGRDPATASIAVTEGLLKTLNRDELQAVVAHEMAHVQNLDTRLMTLLAAMVGAIALMSDGLGRMTRGGGRTLGNVAEKEGDSGKGGNPLGILLLVLWLLTLVVAPIVSRLMAMAVSRKREYLADATGAQFTRNPDALASALEKLTAAAAPTRALTQGAAHLCIVDPTGNSFAGKEGFLGDLFASHPPIAQRIIRLKGMAYQAEKHVAAGQQQ
jgi:heat shock protein HtpX